MGCAERSSTVVACVCCCTEIKSSGSAIAREPQIARLSRVWSRLSRVWFTRRADTSFSRGTPGGSPVPEACPTLCLAKSGEGAVTVAPQKIKSARQKVEPAHAVAEKGARPQHYS